MNNVFGGYMSVVVAVKDGDRIVMGADTQTSAGDRKEIHVKLESNFKISKMPNGILIGSTGRVACSQQLLAYDEWFVKLPKDGLTKAFIVSEIVPLYREVLDGLDLLDEKGRTEATHILAWKDRMFYIAHDFTVVESKNYLASGCGRTVAIATLKNGKNSVLDRVLKALRNSERFCVGISSPFILIDTERLEFEIVK